MTNFIIVDKKVRFEINLLSVRNVNLKLSAKLLEISTKAIQECSQQEDL